MLQQLYKLTILEHSADNHAQFGSKKQILKKSP